MTWRRVRSGSRVRRIHEPAAFGTARRGWRIGLVHRYVHRAARGGRRGRFAHHCAGTAGFAQPQRAPIPAQRQRLGHRDHSLHRCERRFGARVHHHAAGASHLGVGRHRLRRVAKFARSLGHHRAAQTQLRFDQSLGRDQLESGPGAQRPAARGRGAGHQYRQRRLGARRGLSPFHLRHSRAQRNHRLPRAGHPAAVLRHPRGTARRNPRRARLCHAHLAQARPDGRAQCQSCANPPGPGRQQLSLGRRPDQRLAGHGQSDRQYRPQLGGGVRATGHPRE